MNKPPIDRKAHIKAVKVELKKQSEEIQDDLDNLLGYSPRLHLSLTPGGSKKIKLYAEPEHLKAIQALIDKKFPGEYKAKTSWWEDGRGGGSPGITLMSK